MVCWKINSKEFVISKIAYDESVQKASDEFKAWLSSIEIIQSELNDLYQAEDIRNLLEIEEENYGSGVGENDIIIIAIAKRLELILVTDEKRQPVLGNTLKKNYKIPAVCGLIQIGVENINFTELLRINP